MTVDEALAYFAEHKDVRARLQPLVDVGLEYLTLGQAVPTLSGGEAQRLKLAGELADSGAKGPTLYLFDEPTTGLHFADVEKLVNALERLVAAGHSVVVIEHNLDVVAAADWIIDLGPEGGDAGGYVVATGTPDDIRASTASHTGAALCDYDRARDGSVPATEAGSPSAPPETRRKSGPSGSAAHIPVRRRSREEHSATPPPSPTSTVARGFGVADVRESGAPEVRDAAEAEPGVAGSMSMAPRGTVCAQGCAQPSRMDAISGVSREGPSTAALPRPAPLATSANAIEIVRAREHNLRDVSITIPRDKFVVITGVSGSGKSTVAFDILFAEGQRRYLESLNAYARQFVEPAGRADVDAVYGIPPTVAIEQRTSRGGRKSTVATLTEIYHFLRLLFVKLGVQHCPDCGVPIDAQSVESIHAKVMKRYRDKRIALLSPLVIGRKGYYTELAEWASVAATPRCASTASRRRPMLAAARSVQGARHRAAGRRDRRRAPARGARRAHACAALGTMVRVLDLGRNMAGVVRGQARTRPARTAAEAVAKMRGGAELRRRGRRRLVSSDRARVPELRPELRAARSAALLVQLALRLVPELLRHRREARRLRRSSTRARRPGG